ncbi:hypothetical protein ES319_D12G294700v1 [Gossypium barbadense]|uniref:Uncharacterized protein n=1 Tax=Gossypium barbadense TaxID=3634 RepID=A0A5J5P6S2_GOSBA|nr:hypothetical protein ES319_D12G294700v1 [Gossypium barbadense]PPD71047.1 hypothetical protein GOBAR_DD32072 [Gossypium barbadense]
MAMEDNKGNKRTRVEFEDFETEGNLESVHNSKLARVDSENTGSNSSEVTYVEPDPDDEGIQSPDVKRIQEDLLDILDDSDPVIGLDTEIQGLDLVIKSFEEEISVPAQDPVQELDSGESRLELGFGLEASGYELDLPPDFEEKLATLDVEERGGTGAVGLADMMGYEFPIPSYESFEFGVGGDWVINSDNNNSHSKSGDCVAFGGLFDTSADISELTWRPESLSAL